MKKIILACLLVCSCSSKHYKYKIVGYVYDSKQKIHDAVAYTDTIYGQDIDSVWYENSNGSRVTLVRPYSIYILKTKK